MLELLNNNDEVKNGFSLVELLVSVAILVIVSGLVFFNQSGFNNSVLLENLAYEISLTIREAQFYGLQSKETDVGDFQAGFGVYFDLDNPDIGPTKFFLYSDDDKDHLYSEAGDTIIDTMKLTNGNFIESLCLGEPCNSTRRLSISFIRPNPTAYINKNLNAGNQDVGEIVIQSPKGEQQKIIVNKIGQIAIEALTVE